MERVMIHLFNRSFAAGCTVLLVFLLRLLLRRLPKGFSYSLWWIVLFRFLCPVTVFSSFSLFPVNPEPVKQDIIYQAEPEIETGVIWVDRTVNQMMGESLFAGHPEYSVNPIQVWLAIGFLIWIGGMILFAGYHLWQLAKLRQKLATAVKADGVESGSVKVKESDQIDGAFVLGIFFPVVYLPATLKKEKRDYILCHEMVHIRRKDYLIKALGLVMVGIHWFNPLAWAGFRGMCMDMEMSCDEQVLKILGRDVKKAYSLVLLGEAEKKSGLLPLAFGKNHTGKRIRNVLAYHKPGVWCTVAAVVLLLVAAAGLMTNPKQNEMSKEQEDGDSLILAGGDGPVSVFVAGKLDNGETMIHLNQKPDSQWLASWKVGGWILSGDTSPEEERDGVSKVVLDYASDKEVVFHGDFGLFSFQRQEDGVWRQQAFIPDINGGEELSAMLEQVVPGKSVLKNEEISDEERFWINRGYGQDRGMLFGKGDLQLGCHMMKMEDGQVGILGAAGAKESEARMIDLYYGYYDPKDQELTQVFLFYGDGREVHNPKGEVKESQWLFERDGYDYYLRTPEEYLDMEKSEYKYLNLYHIPYDRMEMARSKDGKNETLESLVHMEKGSHSKVVLTEDRVIYEGFAEGTVISVKRSCLVSIRLDGSDRQVYNARYGVTDGWCYYDGYIYYGGWTNEGTFPKPLRRVRTDFTGEEEVGKLPGDLIGIRDGGVCLFMDWEQKCIMAGALEKMGESDSYWNYLTDGETGRKQTCTMKNAGDGWLKIVLTDQESPFRQEEYWIRIPYILQEEFAF